MEIAVRKCMAKYAETCDEETPLNLGEKMLAAIDSFRGQLLANPMLLAAVYLDPRFTKYLKVPNKTLAISKLVKVWNHINESGDSNNIRVEDEDDDLEAYLSEGMIETRISNSDIYNLLEHFSKLPPEKPKTNVLEFWERNKYAKPELYKLSQVVYCVAPTQTPTERSNSTLSFVFTRLRGNIGQKLLEDILVARPNADLFNIIVQERLNSIN